MGGWLFLLATTIQPERRRPHGPKEQPGVLFGGASHCHPGDTAKPDYHRRQHGGYADAGPVWRNAAVRLIPGQRVYHHFSDPVHGHGRRRCGADGAVLGRKGPALPAQGHRHHAPVLPGNRRGIHRGGAVLPLADHGAVYPRSPDCGDGHAVFPLQRVYLHPQRRIPDADDYPQVHPADEGAAFHLHRGLLGQCVLQLGVHLRPPGHAGDAD